VRTGIPVLIALIVMLACAGSASADPALQCAIYPRTAPIVADDGHNTQVSVACGGDGFLASGVTITVDSGPAHGTLNPIATTDSEVFWHYRPTPGHRGADAFTVHATDDDGHVSPPVTVSLLVDRLLTCTTNTYPATSAFPIPLRNDAFFQVGFFCPGHEAGDDFALEVTRWPAHGHFTELDDTVDTNIRVTYVPDPGYVGPDEFSVRVLTGQGGGSLSYGYAFAVGAGGGAGGGGSNHEPTCQSLPIAIGIGGVYPVDELCRDADGDPLTFTLVSGPQHGTLRQEPRGVFWYSAEAGFNGWDSFTYVVSDGRAAIQRYVGIQVGAAPAAPPPPTTESAPPVVTVPAPSPPSAPALPGGVKRAGGVRLGAVEAYVPTRAARLGRKAAQVLVLRSAADGVVSVRATLRARGRTLGLRAQQVRIGPSRLGTVQLALDARTRRALRGAHRARLTLRLAARPAGATKAVRDTLTLTVGLP